MKKILSLIIALWMGVWVYAQDKELKFIYIAHTMSTPINELTQDLKELQKYAKNYKDPIIFYLANVHDPIIACYNVCGKERDDENFSTIIGELQSRNYHNVDVQSDVTKIVSLMEQANLQDSDGQYQYSHLYWRFYVTQEYWELLYNERIIAKSICILDLEDAPKDFLSLDIYYSGSEEFKFDQSLPWGAYNLCPHITPVFVQQ